MSEIEKLKFDNEKLTQLVSVAAEWLLDMDDECNPDFKDDCPVCEFKRLYAEYYE